MISIILLSGGLSSRFGSPKALATWGKQPLITHLQKTLLAADLDEIIVVVGAHEQEIKPFLLKHNKIKVVYNKDYKFGQTSSFKAGLKEVSSSAQAVGLLPVDFPLITTETINVLIGEFLQEQPLILVPSFKGKKGHPPFFNKSLRNEIFALTDDIGLNTITHRYEQKTRRCEVNNDGILFSFNTPQELQELTKKLI